MDDKIKKCEKERDEYLNGWKRARADLINYKKDEQRRFEEIAKYGHADIMNDMMAILDSFSFATDLSEGALRIKQLLEDSLKKQGLEEIEIQGTQVLDPNFHEAVTEEPSDQAPGTIIEEIAKGYILHGRVLRPAKVKVASQKEQK